MTNISFKLITDISGCENFWKQLSPNQFLYDNWNFRYCFYQHLNAKPDFYVGYIDGVAIGLLPLQTNNDTGELEFFGGVFMRENRVFIDENYRSYIPYFYNQLTGKIYLQDIVSDNVECSILKEQESNYSINIGEIKSLGLYLQTTFGTKSFKNKKRYLRDFEGPNYELIENRFEDIKFMIDQNITNFDDSSFKKAGRVESFFDLLKLDFNFKILSLFEQDKLLGVTLSIIYNDVYYYVNAGVKKDEKSNIGTYLILKNIENAINNKCLIFDAGLEDCGWKESWHMERRAEYCLLSN